MTDHAARSRARRGTGALVVLGLLVPAACAEDPSDASDTVGTTGTTGTAADGTVGAPPVEPTGVVVEVTSLDNTFRPATVEISVGDEVVWVNAGRNEHDVLSVEGEGWGVEVDDFQPGDRYSRVFTEPGEYRYYCSIHGTADVGMVGTVIVSG